MSYDLVFWLQEPPHCDDPAAVYRALMEDEHAAGLLPFPIADFLGAIGTAFSAAVREPNGDREWLDWVSPDGKASFQVEWSAVHVLVNLSPLNEAHANLIINIAHSLGAPLYDPQTDERFDSALR